MADEAHRGHYGVYEKISYERNDETNELELISNFGTENILENHYQMQHSLDLQEHQLLPLINQQLIFMAKLLILMI